MEKVSATYLRQHVYELLDEVLATGKPLVIERNGQQLQVIPVAGIPARKRRIADWKERDDVYVGDFDELVSMDWSKEWKP